MDRRISKIRKAGLSLATDNVAVLFIAEQPDSDLGDGACFLFGGKDTPTADLCLRGTLNELKRHAAQMGLELNFTLSHIAKEAK